MNEEPLNASFIDAAAPIAESLTEPLIDRALPMPGGEAETFIVANVDPPVASSSRTIIDNAISNRTMRRRGVGIIEDNFFKSKQTGIRRSIFLSNNDDLSTLAMLHGLSFNADMSHEYRRMHLIHHLVHGHCCKPPPSSDVSLQTACAEICKGFSDIRDLSDCILDSLILYIDDMSKLSPTKLFEIANSIDLSPHTKVHSTHCHSRRDAVQRIRSFRKSKRISETRLRELFSTDFEDMSRVAAVSVARSHGIEISSQLKKDDVKELIVEHLVNGRCTQNVRMQGENIVATAMTPSCGRAVSEFAAQKDVPFESDLFKLYVVSAGLEKLSLKGARRLMKLIGLPCTPTDSKSSLKKQLSKWLKCALKGKCRSEPSGTDELREMAETRDQWPQTVSNTLKTKFVAAFKELTSKRTLATVTCASCSTSTLKTHSTKIPLTDIDAKFLQRPDQFELDIAEVENRWLDPEVIQPPMPFAEGVLKDVLVDPAGISGSNDNIVLTLCKTCASSLRRKEVPPLALSNRMYLGPVPSELADLTVIEEAMIARCRAQCWVVQLKEDNQDIVVPTSQRGMKGHIIIYPQNPSAIAESLPPTLEEVTSPLCVLFVGASRPTDEWLRDKAKPLAVRGYKVRNALKWLKRHNRHYKDITINESVLTQLDENPTLPFHIEHVVPTGRTQEVTSRYDTQYEVDTELDQHSVPFQNVVIADVNQSATSNELRAAAFRHMKQKGNGYIQISRGSRAVNEFDNPSMLPMCYPTLFPYGIGGCDDPYRPNPVSMKRHVKHLFSLNDQRFQTHYSFLFIVFNILQRREMLLRTCLKTRKDNFPSVAAQFADLSSEAIHAVSERVSRGDYSTAHSAEEKKVLNLMREVKAVTSFVPGSASSKVAMRNEIKALIVDQGLPHFYVTINPADVYNPLVRFLAGSDIDIDTCLPSDHDYHSQAYLVAKNPAAVAKFFNVYMKAFIKAILGYDERSKRGDHGILGKVKAYYGTVEAQGRGTLHCHMMIWVEGGLNPDEIKKKVIEDNDTDFEQRFVSFIDDTIDTDLIADPDPDIPSYHPCTVRGPLSDDIASIQKDKHLLVLRCQYHTHSKTCYKYDPHQCRFELGENKELRPITVVDPETGEIRLQCLHGLVNNFNETILTALRCNMDIKYIGSGVSAKAVVFYITDYITKSQLHAHVAYAALELAYKKLGETSPGDDSITIRAKRLLQHCAYLLISHQEMSAQQVVSYLMDFEDHFTSHRYVNIFWTSFEHFINRNDPSAECYPARLSTAVSDPDFSMNVDVDTGTCADGGLESNEQDYFEEEVTIRTNVEGSVISKTSAIEDYVYRGAELHDVCVWDYFSRIEKVSKRNDDRSRKRKINDTPYDHSDNSSSDTDVDIASLGEKQQNTSGRHEVIEEQSRASLWDLHYHSNPLLSNCHRLRPRVEFSDEHSDKGTHRQKTRVRQSRLVPVPIGPAIPRRDREDSKERHARLMLILFKPWTDPLALRQTGRSWSAEYALFLQGCEERVKKIIENMQILHECKDARDDHFAKRANRTRHARSSDLKDAGQNHMGEVLTEDLLREHLQGIVDYQSDNVHQLTETAAACLNSVDQSGFFRSEGRSMELGDNDDIDVFESKSVRVADARDNELELMWQLAYEQRKIAAKNALTNTSVTNTRELSENSQTGIMTGMVVQRSFDEIQTNNSDSMDVSIHSPETVVSGNPGMNIEQHVDVNDVVNEWNLNAQQSLAVRLIVEKSLAPLSDPLRLIVSGQGGTGKSRVIQAVSDFFRRKNQSRRLRLASYTGIAARNIGGSTLHSSLNLSSFSRANNATAKAELVAMWQGVDFLFIDEFSMLGCGLLYEISRALSAAKENVTPFGGINIIFAGDFAQLPPVGYRRLYSQIEVRNNTKSKKKPANEKDIIGKMLWLSVRKVVVLKEVWRQRIDSVAATSDRAEANGQFVDLLNRLREGNCTDEDYTLLCGRVVSNVRPNWSSPDWADTPMIISQNESKDVLNNAAAIAFAKRSGRKLHWYYAVDRHDGRLLEDVNLVSHLRHMNSSVTNYRLGRLPLVIGMPVMVASNFDVENGIVNGCSGILESVRYWVDDNGERHALSCVVRSDCITGAALPRLNEHEAVVLADDKPIHFVHPASNKKCTIRRTQLPIMPAFAMTAHKSQGLTLQKAFVDLESCKGSESPYVMISRVKSLDGLLIMRPFNKKKICCRLSEDVRREFGRLRMLELLTLVEHGSHDEVRDATEELTEKGLQNLIGQEYTDIDLEVVNWQSLNARQSEDNRLVTLLTASPNPRKRRLLKDDTTVDHSGEYGSGSKRRRLLKQ